MTGRCPRLVIAGTGSGVGKTSLSLGLTRSLIRRGLRVQTFKVGPDFLDPTYLALASGRTCYNLDGWMTDRAYVRQLFIRTTRDADIAIIEGVMGLYDGASPATLEGSTAEIALWLEAPILLVVNAHGVARSLAAMVKGYAEFDPCVSIAGVIANQSGSEQHKTWLAESLRGAGLPPLVGAMPRGALPALERRHLGLVTADAEVLPRETIDRLADACERFLDLDLVGRLAGTHPVADEALAERLRTVDRMAASGPIRIGIARDEAFHFYYPDNLDMLQEHGAELVEFAPLRDRSLPTDLGGLYFGGGYPEVHAEALSDNGGMLADIRRFAASGRPIYAECGGLMYLGRALTTVDGKRLPLAGVLPIETAMLKNLRILGYTEVTAAPGSVWSDGDATPVRLRGHEYHYSHITADDSAAAGWQPAYSARRRSRQTVEPEGFCNASVLASYVHVHFASCPEAAGRLVNRCRKAP